jgi:quinolinate synthase
LKLKNNNIEFMTSVNNINIDKGYIDKDISPSIDIAFEIKKLCKEKNAVILAHYYQESEVQDIADFVGDSLDLSRRAADTKADIIVFAGVHFMAETAKILSPEKKILIPDLMAGCSLADSCPPDEFSAFLKQYPDHTVITYVNTTAEIKAMTDIACTSTNAIQIVNSLPEDEKIIFAPDRNLGNYIKSQTGRDMVIWEGACHVHEEFSLERILELKKEYSDAKVIVHPECEKPIRIIADHIGSTSSLLNFTKSDNAMTYIVATESGILHQMKLASPQKTFIAAPPNDSTCACNDCKFMKLISLKKIYNTLKYELPEVVLDKELIEKAQGSIKRMLQISDKLGL